MTVNKKYKDSLFRSIFNNKEKLLELYNAIEGTDYRDAQAIDINTLEDIIYIGMKNDISFIIDDTLVLIEHQSTINENMPLRMGIYLFLIWRKITNADPMAKYGRYSREIPNPKLIVLYNGKEDHPAEKTLWLYSLYKKKNVEKKIVDLEVKVLNINKGRNPELERRSKTLADYAAFISKVREYEKKQSLNKAIESAIKYCIDNDILKEYLQQNSSEVNSMLTTEFDLDEYKEVIRMEALEEGIKKGKNEGIEEGKEEGKEEVQNYILDLIEQGLSREEIKKKIEEMPRKNHGQP
ncbi:MAG: Rpn family recombination-promoting nuclease/putative transposase [Leptospirales bacterium]|nr:Rpn family recombination-promoting nuclease/putative transposase [Leptospirales bacterium]